MILYLKNIEAPYICVFDIEHDKGKLIQFAGIMFKRVGNFLYQICRSINIYIKRDSLSDFITNLSGIDINFLNNNGVTIEDFKDKFNSFINVNNDILFVSHGIHQDSMVLKENGISIDDFPHLCTYKLAKRTNDSGYSLSSLSEKYGLPVSIAHNAYEDAKTTAFVLSVLLKLEEEK